MQRHTLTAVFLLAAFATALSQKNEDLLAVQSPAGSGYAFINRRGEIVLPGPYQGGASFSEGLVPININGLWSYIDRSGTVVIPDLHVLIAGNFVEGLAYVEGFNQRYGFIDRSGHAVIPMVYKVANNRDIYQFAEGRVPVMADGKWGYLDAQGQFAIPPQFDEASGFDGGRACVKSGSQTLYINTSGDVLLSTDLRAFTFRGGPLAPVQVGDRWGYMNDRGEILIAPQFEQAAPFSDGLAAVKQKGRWSFIRPDGTTAFTTDAEFVYGFHDGLTLIRDGNGTHNYLTKSGKKLTESGFRAATDFSHGVAKTSLGYIDTSGKFIWKGPW